MPDWPNERDRPSRGTESVRIALARLSPQTQQVQTSGSSATTLTSRFLPVICAAIAVGIFIADTATPAEIAFGVLYVGVVLPAARFLQWRGVVLATLGCMALTVLSHVLSPHEQSLSIAVANRLISLVTIGVAGFIAVQGQFRELVLREQASLLDLTHDTIFVRDMDDVIVYWNRGAEELYGWKKAEAIGNVTHQLLQTVFPVPLEEITAGLLRTGRWQGELVHTKKDGTPAMVASRWSLQRDARGHPAATLETNNDITERKRVEDLTGQVFESSPDGIAVIGRDYRFQRVNPVYERIWQIRADGFVGQHVGDLLGTEFFEQEVKPYLDRCLTGEGVSFAGWFAYPVGRRYRVVSYWPLRLHSEQVEAALAIVRDLTEHALASEALQAAQAELAHVNRVTTMGQLTASIAHEVNQPIAAVVTNADAALNWLNAQPPNLDQVREILGQIANDGNRAGDVIGRIRTLIKKAPPRRGRFDLNEAILEVIALARSEVLKHGVSLQTGLATGLPAVDGDRVQLQQVILNLILNAVEAMSGVDEGAREVLISTEADAAGGVLVTVRDSGMGLDPNDADRLFEAFYTTKPEGMGMGLAICRSIIAAHGGRLWATANEPRGAVLQFTLPPELDETALAERAGHMPVV
ncbi:PAS domain-containing protein [Bradyrhizobium huanghuaihaiense]|uniref:PAS domain-containing sensor histidine kinase n=1 Tax=Bradyrhizobium huanghuaihaiense TaxID=990078 RepID=UPI0021A9DDAB|nr:PAS domain-containing sensor histidine kinase [Bradyrhizobium sp. CB3035]UWU79111.1 PAS domain-containing protein [Bradyrhizobium sp. CB3035]